ncbi:protein ZBED8-like [Aphis craccivora]|uniref:Protein ZBED8-like n=1 Tax=Aphis craccivora TaxID=307492 RepID=A0A6G0VNM4_APHCR|nr:protein ZBED8-like [Aphis craccivora]
MSNTSLCGLWRKTLILIFSPRIKIAEIIVKILKPHTIAESLILPPCSEIVQIMFGDDAKNEIIKIQHSDNTIKNGWGTCLRMSCVRKSYFRMTSVRKKISVRKVRPILITHLQKIKTSIIKENAITKTFFTGRVQPNVEQKFVLLKYRTGNTKSTSFQHFQKINTLTQRTQLLLKQKKLKKILNTKH